jgi:hypothetical protein
MVVLDALPRGGGGEEKPKIKVSNGYIIGWDCGHYIGRAGKSKKDSAVVAKTENKNIIDFDEAQF